MSGSPAIINFSILFTIINHIESLEKWRLLETHLSMLGVSDGNPDQDERLVPNTPGLNGNDAYANFFR
jgi:hypothetical protein